MNIRTTLIVLSVAIGLTVLFWFPLWNGGGMVGGDVYTYSLPQKVFFSDRLAAGEFPLWNSTTGHGYPIVGESQTGVFYPFNLLFYSTLSAHAAYNTEHLLHYTLAFVFCVMFARKLGLSTGGALLAALVYVYGWFPVRSSLEWAIITGAWLPLALWSAESFLQSPRRRYVVLLSVVLGVQLLAGHYHLAFMTDLLLAVYVPARLWWAARTRHEIRCIGLLRMRTVYLKGDHPSFPTAVQVTGVSALMREIMVRLAVGAEPRHLPHLAALLVDEIAALNIEPLHLPRARDARIARLASTLREDPADPTSLRGWAERLGLSPRTLIRRIKDETGMTFRELRRQTRILAALEYLSLGESVTNVALDVGFDSPSAFIQAFRSVTGKTPGRYMK